MKYDSIKQTLKRSGMLRCSQVTRALRELGFIVRDGKVKNHKIFTHPPLSQRSDFITGSFNCEHGKDGQVKRPYIVNIIRILDKYENELKELEREGDTYV